MAIKKIVLAVAAMGFAAPLLAQEDSELTVDQVPQALTEEAQAEEAERVSVELTSASMDEEAYELSGTMQNGMGFEATCSKAAPSMRLRKKSS